MSMQGSPGGGCSADAVSRTTRKPGSLWPQPGAPEVVGIGELAIEAAEHQVADLAGGPAYVHLRIADRTLTSTSQVESIH